MKIKVGKAAFLTLVILSCLFLVGGTTSYARDPVSSVTKELICTCGCGKVAYDCYCDLAKEWKEQIAVDLAAGKTKTPIIASYVEIYGDGVLATPKKSGLELSIWTLPVIAIILGTAVIYTYAQRKSPIPDSEVDSEILDSGHSSGRKKKKDNDISKSVEHYDNLLWKDYQKKKNKKKC